MLWLTALPWALLLLLLPMLIGVRGPRLRAFAPPPADRSPLVSIIVPARNEALNISACVASLMNSLYPHREIIVVDDGSVDGTGDIVRILAEHADGGIRVIEGEPLPRGWLGKSWACWQGYRVAKGELLLFTDADTRHDDVMLGHAVGCLQSRDVDLVSAMPRQLMGSFWERLVQPFIFTMLLMRFHDLNRLNRSRRPEDVLANGQFILVRRPAYEAIGGHEALRGEVVEDQRLAQRFVAAGRRIFLARADDLIETRMYRSLREIAHGWSKNLALGARQAAPAWIRRPLPWLVVLFIAVVWILPPAVLILSLFTAWAAGLQAWALAASLLALAFWIAMYAALRAPPHFALAFPLASAIVAALFVRSTLQGPRIAWKGRNYDVGAAGPQPRDPSPRARFRPRGP